MFTSVESLLHAAEAGDKPLWEVILEDDMADRSVAREASWKKMTGLWSAMQAAEADYDPARRSASGLVGGEGGKMAEDEASLCGPFLQDIITTALKMGECNACMRRIVAAPTAGACGVLPAVSVRSSPPGPPSPARRAAARLRSARPPAWPPPPSPA